MARERRDRSPKVHDPKADNGRTGNDRIDIDREFADQEFADQEFADRRHRRWMAEALAEADRASAHGDVPVGAVVVHHGEGAGVDAPGARIVGRGHNRREVDGDPLAHAELIALAEAARAIDGWRLVGTTLYVTLEPCAMCAGALVNARVDRLVFAAPDPKAGWCGSLGDLVREPRLNHRLEVVSGVEREQSAEKLRSFFRALRRRTTD